VSQRDSQLHRLQASVEALESRSTTLQQQLAQSRVQGAAALAAAQEATSTARQELARVTGQLRNTTDELNTRLAQIAEQSAAVQRIREELAGQQSRRADADTARAALQARLRQTEEDLAESRRKLAELNASLDQLGQLRQSAQTQLAQGSVAPKAPRQLPQAANFGKYHALIIGSNNYTFIPRLKSAISDATAIADVLRDNYGFDTQVLLDANRYQLLHALDKLRQTLTSDDNLLIYYAGHGTVDPDSDRGYWLPVDAEADSTANWIPAYQITDFLKTIPAKQIMLVADSCYSGMLTRSAITRLETGLTDEERDRWYQTMAKKHARVVLTSGGNQPVLDGGSGGHSVFAAALIQILQDNHDVLEGQRLAQEVTKRVAVSVAAATIDQIPTYAPLRFAGHEAGDFFFVPR